MASIVTTADFTGKYDISSNNFTKLEDYIEDYEKAYLIDLLGIALYDLFIANITDTIYQKLVDMDLLKMLKGFIYFEYLRDEKFKATTAGTLKIASEISKETSFSETKIYEVYNTSVKIYNDIQDHIEYEQSSDYPTYKGKDKDITSPFI